MGAVRSDEISLSIILPVTAGRGRRGSMGSFTFALDYSGVITFNSICPSDPSIVRRLRHVGAVNFGKIGLRPRCRDFFVSSRGVGPVCGGVSDLKLVAIFRTNTSCNCTPPCRTAPREVGGTLG